jgi:hypothetical protein
MPEITGPLAFVALVSVIFFVARNARAWYRYYLRLQYGGRIIALLEAYRDKRREIPDDIVREMLRAIDRLENYHALSEEDQIQAVLRANSVLLAEVLYRLAMLKKEATHG